MVAKADGSTRSVLKGATSTTGRPVRRFAAASVLLPVAGGPPIRDGGKSVQGRVSAVAAVGLSGSDGSSRAW